MKGFLTSSTPRIKLIEIIQFVIILFTMVLLFSEEIEQLAFMKLFYETQFSMLCLVFGIFSVIRGLLLVIKGITHKGGG